MILRVAFFVLGLVGPSAAASQPTPTSRSDTGRVVLDCATTSAATVTDCRVVSEEPAGEGFGEDALRLASQFRLHARSGSSRVPKGRIRIPITFKAPADGEPNEGRDEATAAP